MFVDVSPVLALPFILPSQAQKHVTHNEALRILDALVQMSVTSRNLATPPASPVEGDRYIVGPAPTGAWLGQAGAVTQYDGNAWLFYPPKAGWTAWVVDEAEAVVQDGTGWLGASQRRLTVQELGVSATPDAQNRLSVSSPATLLNHAGAGHQLKLNKAAVGDTASLLFQTGFSGRAEMGLAGNDGFGVKSSFDGTAWVDALFIPPTGRPQLPQGMTVAPGSVASPSVAFTGALGTGAYLTAGGAVGVAVGGVARAVVGLSGLMVDGALTGTAVTQTATDLTPGRVTRTGDFGLGSTTSAYGVGGTPTGLADLSGTQFFMHPATGGPGDAPEGAVAGAGLKVGGGAQSHATLWTSLGSNRWYARSAPAVGGASAWTEMLTQARVLGPVSQLAGLPTGALIERASNANGTYVRFADGTQICTRNTGTLTSNIAVGNVFLSGSEQLAFAAVFSQEPTVALSVVRVGGNIGHWVGPLSATSTQISWRLMSAVSGASGFATIVAVGRWF